MPTLFTEGIRITPEGFPEALKLLAEGDPRLRTLVKNVLANTITYTDKEIRYLVENRYDITSGSLNDQSHRAKFRTVVTLPTVQDLEKGGVQVFSNRFPTMRFRVSPTEVPNQKGIPVSQRVIVSRTTVRGLTQSGSPNRFLARMQSGHIGVFMRKKDSTHRTRPDGQRTQLNISEEHMISVAEMLRSKAIAPILQQKIKDRVENRFNAAFTKRYWLRDAFNSGGHEGGGGGGVVSEIEGAAEKVAGEAEGAIEGAAEILPELL